MEFASPRWAAYDDTDTDPLSQESRRRRATYAVSAQYAAYANRKGVFARKLATNEHYKRLFRYEDHRPWFQPVLAFSTLGGKLLAIATGVQILVFDVDTKQVKHALKGNGRIITSLAWAESKPGILATGAVDGSICVWSLQYPARPLYHVRAFHGACNHVAFHPKDHELLAGCHKNCISVWALPSTKPFLVTKSKDTEFKALRWFATDPLRVLGISSTGSVSIYEVHHALKLFRNTPPRPLNDIDEIDTMFGKLDDIGYMPALDFHIGMKVSQAMLVGRNGLIVLPSNGHILFFIAFFAEKDDATELWRLRLDDLIDCFSLRVRDKTVHIVACMGQETQSYEIPGTVLDGMGWDFSASTNSQYASKMGREREELPRRKMRPELSIYHRLGQSPPPKNSLLCSSHRQRSLEPSQRDVSPLTRKTKTSLPSTRPTSMTSSLQLPKGDDSEHDSPLPFLSASRPALRTSLSHTIAPVDESLRLPPRASFDSITSTAGHDSDSDDETFAENLQGSGSYLPGGVNVPLPRTCGALFSASGQLLTFFLTRTKPASVNGDTAIAFGTRERQDSEVTRLFPSFGNLGNMSRNSAVATESEDGSPPKMPSHIRHRDAMPIHSFDENVQWSTRISPIKATKVEPTGQQKVVVSVHEVQALQHAQQLAYNYRLLPEEYETAAELCLKNAQFASGAGLDESAEMWRLLAVLLEPRSCDKSELALQARDPAVSPVSQRPVLSRNLSLASSYVERSIENDVIMLNWLRHPLGRSWAIERILRWAELNADVQLLACISALLIRVSETIRAEAAKGRTSLDTNLNPVVNTSQTWADAKTPPSIPLLRTDTALSDASLLGDSPVKPYSSRTSSRDTSLPNTPYIDSSANTPPLSLPPLARHNTRLSASGSASPEAHRGSFSAAAKYAQTIIFDKLGGYSTSPPTRRLGGSPGNELSTSLPTGTGSWSKSVSFAAASDTLQDSQRSLSLAQEDDNYDSDRTIDEMSLPRTPNSSAGIVIRELNGQSFYDDQLTALHDTSFLPEHLISRCSVWRSTYAEQLRSWDLVIQAAELETTVDLAEPKTTDCNEKQNSKVVPHMDPQCRGATCCICYCLIKAAKQLCPACLHTTHPHCLEEFVARVDEAGDRFTCPVGCGCECTAAGQEMYELSEGSVEDQPWEPAGAE